jgi:hypothetical protein
MWALVTAIHFSAIRIITHLNSRIVKQNIKQNKTTVIHKGKYTVSEIFPYPYNYLEKKTYPT